MSDAPPTAGRGFGSSAEPYSMYRAWRESQPVFPSSQYERTWVLTRFADCDAVLGDSRWGRATSLFAKRKLADDAVPAGGPRGVGGTRMLLFTDGQEHTRVRRLMTKAFTPRAIERLRPRIQRLVDDILDKAAADGELDVMQDLAAAVPITVICEILGVPLSDRHKFKPWSVQAARGLDGPIDADTAAKASAGWKNLLTYIDELIADHRANPGDDLLSALIAVEEEGDRLTTNELRVNAMGLLIGGHETSTNLIGNGINALLRHPDQLARWHGDPSLTGSAIEELLRFDPMVQVTSRVATADIEVGGFEFHTGDHVIVLIGAANRDPARFPDPDRLDLGRNDGPHLSFGYGVHYCLGAALARLEGQIAIGSLVARFPDMRMLTPDVRYREHINLRGLTELRVAV